MEVLLLIVIGAIAFVCIEVWRQPPTVDATEGHSESIVVAGHKIDICPSDTSGLLLFGVVFRVGSGRIALSIAAEDGQVASELAAEGARLLGYSVTADDITTQIAHGSVDDDRAMDRDDAWQAAIARRGVRVVNLDSFVSIEV